MKIYKAKLKSRKQIMAEIPREQQGWWADVCAGQTLTLRDATAADVARCCINEGQSRDPADYLCEACERGSLVRRIAIKELTGIPDRRATLPSPSTASEPPAREAKQSIDTDEFSSLIGDLLQAFSRTNNGEDDSVYLIARRALIAYIDGRTAGAAPEKLTRSMCAPGDYCQGWNDCVDDFNRIAAAPAPTNTGTGEDK